VKGGESKRRGEQEAWRQRVFLLGGDGKRAEEPGARRTSEATQDGREFVNMVRLEFQEKAYKLSCGFYDGLPGSFLRDLKRQMETALGLKMRI
jgi:hypothetical protein